MKRFRDALRSKDFVVTAEIPLYPTQTVADIETMVDSLGPIVDAIQVGDNDAAEAHIAPLAVAKIALDSGVDPLVHMGARDRNRIGLQSDMLGLAAFGVTSLLLKRGNKLPATLKGRVRGVFDSRTAQIVAMARRVSENSTLIDAPGFLLGSPITVIAPDPNWQAERVIEKIETGVRFLQTRPTLDFEAVRMYASRLVALRLTHRASFLVTIPLLTSIADARRLANHWPAAEVPELAKRRIASETGAREEGIASTAAILKALQSTPGVAGANLVFYSDTDAVADVLTQAGLSST